MPALQTADRARCLLPSASKTAQATPKYSQCNICCFCTCCFGSALSLALKNALAQLSCFQTANFLPEEKNQMVEAELQMLCLHRLNESEGGKKITFPTNTIRRTKMSVSFKKAVKSGEGKVSFASKYPSSRGLYWCDYPKTSHSLFSHNTLGFRKTRKGSRLVLP